jgi:hypothetical protein
LLAIRANDLWLVEIPLVRGRVDVELRALWTLLRSGGGDVSERTHARRVGREQQSRMDRYQGFIFACRSRTEKSKKERKKQLGEGGREGWRRRGWLEGMHAARADGDRVGVREGNARRRRSVSRICVSTSLMPTPGPPLREREGIMRRGRDAAAGAEAEGAGAEGPACEAAAGSVFEGPPLLPSPPSPPPPPPLTDVDAAEAAAEVVVVVAVVEFACAAATANDTLAAAGSAVDADARLGMGPRRTRGQRWTLLF